MDGHSLLFDQDGQGHVVRFDCHLRVAHGCAGTLIGDLHVHVSRRCIQAGGLLQQPIESWLIRAAISIKQFIDEIDTQCRYMTYLTGSREFSTRTPRTRTRVALISTLLSGY
jgi:hypothetical protein